MDTATRDIRALELTSGHEGDHARLPDMLTQSPDTDGIESVTADGALCDTRRCLEAILACGAGAIIQVRRNGRMWKSDPV